MNGPTFKNHYIPCFWSALWNNQYYDKIISNQNDKQPRNVKLWILNLKSNNIYSQKAEKVFFIKQMGQIPISQDEYLELIEVDKTLPETPPVVSETGNLLIMDIENHFTTLEEIIGYEYIFKIIKDSTIIKNYENRLKISAFLFYHPYRGHRYLLDLFDKYSEYDNFRFRAMYEWKYLIDKETHTMKITDILESRWTLYSLNDFHFPLCDNPIINDGKEIIAIISPKHLIKIELDIKNKQPAFKTKIGCLEYRRIIKKVIENTDSVIVNGDPAILETIQKSKRWKKKGVPGV